MFLDNIKSTKQRRNDTKKKEYYTVAKKYYDELDVCESWMNAVFTYIFDENIGNFNRVKRAHSKKTNLHKRMTD